jgi:hypothetical protein
MLESGPNILGDLLALPGPDHHGHVPAGGDAAVAQELTERADGAASNVDGEWGRDQAG